MTAERFPSAATATRTCTPSRDATSSRIGSRSSRATCFRLPISVPFFVGCPPNLPCFPTSRCAFRISALTCGYASPAQLFAIVPKAPPPATLRPTRRAPHRHHHGDWAGASCQRPYAQGPRACTPDQRCEGCRTRCAPVPFSPSPRRILRHRNALADLATLGLCLFRSGTAWREDASVGGSWGQSSAPQTATESPSTSSQGPCGEALQRSVVVRRRIGPAAGITRCSGPGDDHSCPRARLAARGLPLRPQRSGSAFTRAE